MATEPHELFASKVSIKFPIGCWTWMGTKGKHGHGVFAWSKKRCGAHRYSWSWFNGRDVPSGMMVLHSCQNPSCVNPLHLRLGTQVDNMSDRKLVGNYLRGEKNVRSVITDEQAQRIFDDKRTCRVIAEDYGIKRDVVQRIRQGQTYANITGGKRSPFQKSKGRR